MRTTSVSGAFKPQRLDAWLGPRMWDLWQLKRQSVAIARYLQHHNHKRWANRQSHVQCANGTLSTDLRDSFDFRFSCCETYLLRKSLLRFYLFFVFSDVALFMKILKNIKPLLTVNCKLYLTFSVFLPEWSISKLYTGCQLLKCKYLKQKLLNNVQHLPSRKKDRKWPKGKLEWKTGRKLQLHNHKLSVSYGNEHGVFNHEKMRLPSTVLPVTPITMH